MSPEQKPRVLHLGKYYWPHKGGMETYLHLLCGKMKDLVDLRVIVSNDGSKTIEEQVDGIQVTRVGTLFKVSSASISPGLVRRIREANPDIVHVHFPNPTAILALLSSGYHGRVLVSYHSDIVKQRLLGKAFEPFLHYLLNRSSAVIAALQNYVESSSVLRAHRARCRIIPYGISLERFEAVDREAVAAIRREHGPRIVLAVGRLVYYKGFEHLIQAMRHVQGKLLIVGDGPLKAKLQADAELAGVRERVVILGHVDDVVSYYHAADVFTLASCARSEAFGIVQLEAMACGKPVVNTALDSGVPFVSMHGVTGLTVNPADPDGLAAAISLLLDDRDLRERYGQAARLRLHEQFSLEEMTRRTFQLYREIMESPTHGLAANGLRVSAWTEAG